MWEERGDYECGQTRKRCIVRRNPIRVGFGLQACSGLIVKGKRISCPPHYDYEHGFPLIRSLRASAQRSTSVLFSFVLSLLIVAGSFAIRQSKTILARS
jgi:hypothetical protein